MDKPFLITLIPYEGKNVWNSSLLMLTTSQNHQYINYTKIKDPISMILRLSVPR